MSLNGVEVQFVAQSCDGRRSAPPLQRRGGSLRHLSIGEGEVPCGVVISLGHRCVYHPRTMSSIFPQWSVAFPTFQPHLPHKLSTCSAQCSPSGKQVFSSVFYDTHRTNLIGVASGEAIKAYPLSCMLSSGRAMGTMSHQVHRLRFIYHPQKSRIFSN